MKLNRVILVLLIALTSSCVSFKVSDLKNKNLKGRVLSITEEKFNLKRNVKDTLVIFTRTDFFFNKKGYLISKVHYLYRNPNNTLSKIVINNYNGKGQIINTLSFDKDSVLKRQLFYNYSLSGKKVAQYEVTKDGVTILYGYTLYDKYGNKLAFFDNSNKMTGFNENKYDNNGRLIQVNHRRSKSDNKFYGINIYKYDDRGNKIESTTIPADSGFVSKGVFKYNDLGDIIESSFFSRTNRFLSVDKLLDAELRNTENYFYQYKYDFNDNWIEQVQYEYGRITSKIVRSINYF